VNATFFLLGAACLGADHAPAQVAAPGHAVVASAAGCGGCGDSGYGYATASNYGNSGCSNDCGSGSRAGFFSRLKSKLCHKKSSSCGNDACAPAPAACAPAPCAPAPVACAPAPVACAPSCGTPVYTGFTTSSCSKEKGCLFSRLRSKMKHSSSACDSCSAPVAYGSAQTGCSTGPALVAPGGPVVPPKEMPLPPKEEPKPKTTTLAPSIPLAPAEFTGTAGKY